MRKLYHFNLSGYKLRYLKSDLIAAIAVTAIAVPQSLGLAAIAGLPPIHGLYTALLAPILFGAIAYSRRLIVGADSATAALVASGALLVAQAGTLQYANAVAMLVLLVAGVLFIMAALRMSFLADLISRPVLVGFFAGVGVQLIVGQFPAMLGLAASGSLWQHVTHVFGNLTNINGMAATISLLVVGLVLLLRKTRIPGELVGLVAAIAFAYVFHVEDFGAKLIGALPAGLPDLTLPSFSLGMITTLLPAALSIALVILAQSSSVIRSLAGEHDEKTHINQDLLALGVANAASALTQGFVVNGSPPRSLAADIAGGRSSLVNVFMGVMVAVLLIFGGNLFAFVPTAALSAIIFVIGWRLIRFHELKYLMQSHRSEFVVASIALVGTALFGVYQGVMIAVVVSLMERLRRQYRPKDEILLRDGELSEWAVERLGGKHIPGDVSGLLIYKFDGALFFENVQYFVKRLKSAIDDAGQPVHYVLIDAGAIDNIDYTAMETVKTLYRQISSDDVGFGLAHVSPNLRKQFDAYGMTNLIGRDNIFSTLSGAIKAYPMDRQSSLDKIKSLKLGKDNYVVIGGAVLEVLNLRKTNDVDILVSDDVYARYRDEKRWTEYTMDNGKKILTHDSFNLSRSWMGRSFGALRKNSFESHGVVLIGIDDLIAIKRQLGRKKDREDVLMLIDYRNSARRKED